jgi:hypothetical protein
VRERLVVLLLGERVDRAELLAAALQALDRGAERGALASGSGLGAARLQAEAAGERGELALGLGGAVARLLRRGPRRGSRPRRAP